MATRWIPMTETGPRITADDVRRYERELGYELPGDYRRFLLDVNGGQPSLERSVLHLRKERSVLNNLPSLNDPDEGNDGNPRPTGSNPRVEWFERRDVCKLADSFAGFLSSLKALAHRPV
jgi:hypothetical protein